MMTCAIAALCCAAFAQRPEGGDRQPGGPRRGMHMREGGMMPMGSPLLRILANPEAAEKLGLSEEQKAKLKELDKKRLASRDARDEMREAMRRQTTLMEAEKIDESALMAAIDEVFALRKAMAKEQAKTLIAIKSILTPEQAKKASEELKGGSYGPGGGMHRGTRGERHGTHGDHQGPRGGQRRRPGGRNMSL